MTVAQHVRDRVVALALDGMPAASIYEEINRSVPYETIKCWIIAARKAGVAIPRQITRRHTVIAKREDHKKPAPAAVILTPEEVSRLADYARQDIGLTKIAALMRRPYAVLADEIDRQGLSRGRAA